MITNNLDPNEIAKFDAIANNWWNPQGEMKMLHELNPVRLQYIENQVALSNKKILDVGCGGGILTESLATHSTDVMGIDLSEQVLNSARAHALQSNLAINYQQITVEELAQTQSASFDVITCMEMLEHVPNPSSIIKACADLLKPQGRVIFSTLNRHLKSFFYAILGAEYVLQLLPKGTHHYAQFIRPSELTAWACQSGLELIDLKGINYNFWEKTFELTSDVRVNYLITFTKK